MAAIIKQGLGTKYLIVQGFISGPTIEPATLREAVYFRLSTDSGISALVGDRIFPSVLPQGTDYPAVTYFVPSRNYGHNLGGGNGISDARVSISVFSDNPADMESLADAVFGSLDGFRGKWSGLEVIGCLADGEIEIANPPIAGRGCWVYQITSDYMIRHRVKKPNS